MDSSRTIPFSRFLLILVVSFAISSESSKASFRVLQIDKLFTDLKKLDDMQVNDNSLKTLLGELRSVENINEFKSTLVEAQDRINLLLQLIAHSSLRK